MYSKPKPLFSTARQVQYAQGYISLGILDLAARELEEIAPADRLSAEVVETKMHLFYAQESWENLAKLSHCYSELFPEKIEGWLNRAFALRRLNGIREAKVLLLSVEPTFSASSALLHYNLACYHCLLGELGEARHRLSNAFRLDASFRETARTDPDLQTLWRELAEVPSGP